MDETRIKCPSRNKGSMKRCLIAYDSLVDLSQHDNSGRGGNLSTGAQASRHQPFRVLAIDCIDTHF